LHRGSRDDRDTQQELLIELRRTNRLLQTALYVGLGFALGLLAMLVITRLAWLR